MSKPDNVGGATPGEQILIKLLKYDQDSTKKLVNTLKNDNYAIDT